MRIPFERIEADFAQALSEARGELSDLSDEARAEAAQDAATALAAAQECLEEGSSTEEVVRDYAAVMANVAAKHGHTATRIMHRRALAFAKGALRVVIASFTLA